MSAPKKKNRPRSMRDLQTNAGRARTTEVMPHDFPTDEDDDADDYEMRTINDRIDPTFWGLGW